ncbi:TetR/AcrR family transcriptional regulator [Nitratireductor mangrovi]|uniref:TetR/AcrR family transcriptional regulator n=1 Tax=Nitratireductor mangrovi TaxID=2599600 RepID=A0A5B8KYF6_9HYPH|nr:TetR/AcrR family transcriptional regulator [Nitratireductor mangrovi]QDZ00591.1 TetR/AcrR family transcriptional regulator [Nitratireductor mangrovi]
MQQESKRRTNRERTEAMRAQLIAAGRALFTDKGYAETGTPEIVAAAGVTRGALYHHFADKQALFRAVVVEEATRVAEEIERGAPSDIPVRDALIAGGEAFLEAMRAPGRTRLLLLDGPAVLGRADMDEIDATVGGTRSLREGLALAMAAGAIRRMPLEALTLLLSSAYDRAALAVDAGAPARPFLEILTAFIDGLARRSEGGPAL